MFAVVVFPLVVAALAGARVDTVCWFVPFIAPAAMKVLRWRARSIDEELERQAADIARWEV